MDNELSEKDRRQKDLSEKLDQISAILGEHFDAVQILATSYEGGYTECWTHGIGNWYARYAMCQKFLERDKSQESAQDISEALDSGNEGEEE